MKKFILVLSVIWLLFVSIVPRVVEVLNRNFIFLLDHGRDYEAVKNIVINHKPTLIGAEIGYGVAGFQGIFHGPFYFYFLSVPFILFNGDPYGGLLLMFAFGVLTIGASFLFAKKVLGPIGGIVMAALVALSPPIIAQSRFIWSPHPSSFFIVLALYFTYLIYRKKPRDIFLAAFFSGFIYNFEMAIVIPMSIALILYSVFIVRLRKVKQYLFLTGGFIAAFSPFILFEFRHGFQALKGFVGYFVSHQAKIVFQTDKFVENLSWFFYNFSDTFPKQNLFPYTIIFLVSILAVLSFSLKEKRPNLKFFLFYLLSLIAITFITFSLIRTHIFEYYLIHLNFVYLFLFSYVLVSSYAKRQIHFQILLTVFLMTFLFFGTVNAVDTFRKDLSDYGGMVKIRGKIEAIDYIYRDSKGEKFGLLIFSPPVYTYPYDYLLWWYGQRKYNYLPHREKRGVFYLLIEKDLSQPWTYKGWLETVVKSGKVIKETELPSGFIIQKRVTEDEET